MKGHTNYSKIGFLILIAGLAALLPYAFAISVTQAQSAPPPEAIAACENKSPGDASTLR